MDISDIHIGGRYYHFFGEMVEIEEIRGRVRPRIRCINLKRGRESWVSPSELTSVSDYEAEQKQKAHNLRENRRKAREIINAAGEGARIDGRVLDSEVTLLFTEQAALRLLQSCGAKLPAADQLPCAVSGVGAQAGRATRLSRRLRRALKAGHTGEWSGAYLINRGFDHQAMIRLETEDLDVALSSIYRLGDLSGESVDDQVLAEVL